MCTNFISFVLTSFICLLVYFNVIHLRSRCSITIVRTGSAAGDEGPTVILLKGKIKRKTYTDEFLVQQGLKPGSTIIMTENAFMTHDAWYETTKAIIHGYNQMPVIRDNPQWSIVEFYDGFSSHEYEPRSLELRAARNIHTAKEESGTSHVNQAFDQLVAKNDKKVAAEILAAQREMKHVNKGVIDQYGLVHTAIAIVKATTRDMWIKSFRRVALNPTNRQSWDEWVEYIKPFLQAGASFKPESAIDVNDWYAMLPALWRGMSLEERQKATGILASHDGKYTAACVEELKSKLSVPLSDMQNLRICLTLAATDPRLISMGTEADSTDAEGDDSGNRVVPVLRSHPRHLGHRMTLQQQQQQQQHQRQQHARASLTALLLFSYIRRTRKARIYLLVKPTWVTW